MPIAHSGQLLNCKHGLTLSELSNWSIHLETVEATTLHIEWDVKKGSPVCFSYCYKDKTGNIVSGKPLLNPQSL